jgi:ATP-dependent HslUV protease ATP-binding subunit HslU
VTIRLPAASEELRTLDTLTPREIVAELDRHVVGQAKAKRAVAVALRNRIRRQRLPPEEAADVLPKNILMIGPTGVGKTEIARRLARLSGSPLIKVEASKFTEVGYVGRDVESMVRDLAAAAVELVRREKLAEVRDKAEQQVEERLLDLLLPAPPPRAPLREAGEAGEADAAAEAAPDRREQQFRTTRERLRQELRAGHLEHRTVEVDVRERGMPAFQILGAQGVEELDVNLRDMLPGLFGGRSRRRSLPIGEAREVLRQEEESRLVDDEQVARLAIERAETSGIIFIDEIDKIAGREAAHGPDVSREGVQRDLLPIVEGSTVQTKWGPVRTDHVLFIAAGAFHVSKPSDLIPELQGRFPIRVELEPLELADLRRILVEPRSALLRQYQLLLATDGVQLAFTDAAVDAIARTAMEVNESTENIGARRLATILEALLEDVSFEAPEGVRAVTIDADDVTRRLAALVKDRDLSRFIL